MKLQTPAGLAVAFLFAGMATSAALAQPASATPPSTQPASLWVNISDPVVYGLEARGVKITWPGNTAGIGVDPDTGDVFLDVTNLGLWKSTDQGHTFNRIAEGVISGRCECGYSLYFDPAGGGRFAAFMLDGKSAMTLDGGKTWHRFADVGRNWEYGAVDWSDPEARTIFAYHHESGGEMYLSHDAGAHWTLVLKNPEARDAGVFDDHTLVTTEGQGILRSTDAGKTWTKVSDLQPIGRLAIPYKGVTYWMAKGGLIVSRDKGATWQRQGSEVEAAWGPVFGRSEKEILVADFEGFLLTEDGGEHWQRIATLQPGKEFVRKLPASFETFGWDFRRHLLYASRMANAAYRLQLP